MLEKTFTFLTKLVQSILSFLKILFRSNLFLKKHKTETETCIILGNGPSLKKVLENEQDILNATTLICVNKFPDTPHFTKLKPEYFIFASPHYWETDTIDPNTSVRKNIVKALIEKVDWNLNMFCPNQAKSNPSFVQKLKSNPNINLIFYNTTPIEGLAYFNRLFMNLGWGSPRPHNVLIPATLMAINCGFKRILLTGADHSWIPLISVTEENIALVNQQHFYDENTSKSDLMYVDAKTPRRLHEILEKFMYSFRSYFDLKDYAETKGVKIYNCTPGSFIDAFDRKPLQEIYK